MTDPIGDMISRIKNGFLVKKQVVSVPYSKMKLALAKALESTGYVEKVEVVGEKKELKKIEITLRYQGRDSKIVQIRRISKPGVRIYQRHNRFDNVCSGIGVSIISTPKGLMTNKEARKKHLGGEVICEIW